MLGVFEVTHSVWGGGLGLFQSMKFDVFQSCVQSSDERMKYFLLTYHYCHSIMPSRSTCKRLDNDTRFIEIKVINYIDPQTETLNCCNIN